MTGLTTTARRGAVHRARSRRERAAGFSLIEILVSLVASMIVLAGLFAIVSAGMKGFFAQSQIAELQLNLRFALERIKSDLSMAAFLASPDSATDPRVCPKPNPAVSGLRILDATDAVANPGANPFIVNDQLRILGSFASSEYYLTDLINGTDFFLQTKSLPTTAIRHAEIFNPGAFLFIRNHDSGSMQILEVSASDFAASSVSTTLPPRFTSEGGTCGLTGSRGEGHEVSIVNYVNYRVDVDATAPGANKFDLIREFLASDGATPMGALLGCGVAGTTVTVGEFIVGFDVSATADTAAPGVAPSIPAGAADPDLFDDDGGGDDPGSARTVIISLTARTSREDPDMSHIPRGAVTDPIRSFDVDTAVTGAARVRTLRIEVPLPNFVVAGGL